MDTERLLEDLCVRLGFCLDPGGRAALLRDPPVTVNAFADEVIRREGLDPVTFDSTIRHEVRTVVAQRMGVTVGRPRKPRSRGR